MAASVVRPVVRPSGASRGWLFGPLPDLLLGCGVLYVLIFPVLVAAGPALRDAQPKLLFPLLLLLTSTPHYGATLVRIYDRAAERRRYAFFAVWCTLGVVLWYAAGIASPLAGNLLITVYLTWSPWHYTGQNYGLAVMFLRRNGVAFDDRDKRWLHASFLLSYVLVFLVMHVESTGPAAAAPGDGLYAVYAQRLGIPVAWNALLVPVVCIGYLAATAAAGIRLARRAGARALAPSALLVVSQALWFVLPFGAIHFLRGPVLDVLDWRQRDYYFAWIAMSHAVQYLWVSTYYAKHSPAWNGGARYYAKTLAASALLWTGVPILLGPAGAGWLSLDAGLFLLTAAAINVHHFILDGAIWKLRGRIAEILIRSGQDTDEVARAGLGRRLAWAACGLALAISVWSVLDHEVSRRALLSGDAVAAARAQDRLALLGLDPAAHRSALGTLLFERRDFAGAKAQYERSFALAPSREAALGLARVATRAGQWRAAAEYGDAALALEPNDVALLIGTARAWLRAGDSARARERLDRALAESPGDPRATEVLAQLASSPR